MNGKLSQRKESEVMKHTKMHDALQEDEDEVVQILNAEGKKKYNKMVILPIAYYDATKTIHESTRDNSKVKKKNK